MSRSSHFSRRITVAAFRFAEKRPRSCFSCFDIDTSVEGTIAPSGVSQSVVLDEWGRKHFNIDKMRSRHRFKVSTVFDALTKD